MNIKARTTYEREFVGPSANRPRDVRQYGQQHNAKALLKQYEQATGKGMK